ncbi:MAG: DUF4838 domain-containing protein [Victivallales bacterium]|jgi:hypothetical protein|nr:DUF4838 domain-containing protein [Victivallales bacterium]
MREALAAFVLSALCAVVWAAEFKPDALGIVLPASPSATERFAAKELSRYIELITGSKVAISERMNAGQIPIYIGSAADKTLTQKFSKAVASIEHDAFVLEISPEKISVAGNSDRGTIYGVYQLLEELGCRWFFPGKLGEFVPDADTLSWQNGKREFVPDFNQRTIDIGQIDSIDFEESIDWCVKNRLNFVPASRQPFVRRFLPDDKQDVWTKRGGQQAWQFHVHNLNQMLPAEKYFAEHPEYYALYKGKRHAIGTPGRPGYGGGNICTTNPDVIKICAEFIIDYFDRTPEGMVVPLWPGDGAIIWCECPECRKLGGRNFMNGKRGSMTKRMVTFANAVAKIVAQKYPDRIILLPAYANYILPVDIPLEKNIMVQLCVHGCYAHGIDKCEPNLKEVELLKGWAKTAAGRFGCWEYFLLGDHYSPNKENNGMLPVIYRVRDTLPYFHKLGMNNYMTQCTAKYWKHNMLAYYLTARYAWKAEQDFAGLLDDFCTKMYGNAAPMIKEYIVAVEDATAKAAWHPVIYSDLAVPSPKVFTPGLLGKAEDLLQKAQSAELNPVQKRRVALIVETFNNIKGNIGTQTALGLDAEASWRIIRAKDNYVINPDGKALSDSEVERLKMNALDVGDYSDEFKRILFRARKRQVPIIELANKEIAVDVIPELGGRAIRLIDRKTKQNIFNEPTSDPQTSIGEKYFNYGGYEEYIGKAFAGDGWESAFTAQKSANDITMVYQNENYKLERKVSVENSTMKIESTLTNITNESLNSALRTHPQFNFGENCSDFVIETAVNGKMVKSTVNMEHDKSVSVHDGVRRIRAGKSTVTYKVESNSGGALYLCKVSDNVFNLEFLGKEKSLKPGESIKVVQTFTIERE